MLTAQVSIRRRVNGQSGHFIKFHLLNSAPMLGHEIGRTSIYQIGIRGPESGIHISVTQSFGSHVLCEPSFLCQHGGFLSTAEGPV